MKKLSDVLKRLMREHELNTSKVARSTGILQPVVHRMVAGDTDNPRIDTLLPIARYFNISIEQLLGLIPIENKNTLLQQIPLLQWQNLEKNLAIKNTQSTEFIVTNTFLSTHAYALRVQDSTMLPLFNEHTFLLVDPALKPEDKDFCVIAIDDHQNPTLRQIFFNGADIHLKPLNTEFKTIVIDKTVGHRFLGVVVETKTTLKLL